MELFESVWDVLNGVSFKIVKNCLNLQGYLGDNQVFRIDFGIIVLGYLSDGRITGMKS